MGRQPERTAPAPLPPMRAEQARRLLAPPWLPTITAPSIARAYRARPLAVPVQLLVPTPALGVRLARALHATSGPTGDLAIALGDAPELRALPAGSTLVVEPARLDDVARLHLEALLDDGEVWVIAVVTPDVVLDEGLAQRLASIVVDVPPLTRRTLELPALSSAILQTIAQRAGRPTPALSPAARTRVTTHPWAGDLLELEQVLAHALATTDGDTIDVPHLGFEPEPVPIEAPTEPRDEAAAAADQRLELLLAELSHELLNPLVTVKTFAGHLPQLLGDDELRAQFAERADDAIARMQQLLDNVVEFARLGAPRHEAVEVGPVLDRLLNEVAPELAARAVRVRRNGGPSIACEGDPAQLEYALRNLLAGVVREVPARDELVVDTAQNGVVNVRFAAGDATAARLRRLVAPEGAGDLGDPTMLPLAFTLARTVLERNGGSLDVREDPQGPTTLVVRLPTAVGMR